MVQKIVYFNASSTLGFLWALQADVMFHNVNTDQTTNVPLSRSQCKSSGYDELKPKDDTLELSQPSFPVTM